MRYPVNEIVKRPRAREAADPGSHVCCTGHVGQRMAARNAVPVRSSSRQVFALGRDKLVSPFTTAERQQFVHVTPPQTKKKSAKS